MFESNLHPPISTLMMEASVSYGGQQVYIYTRLHGDTSHKTALFILRAVITLNPKHKVFTDTALVMILLTHLETDGMVLERNTEARYC
jgi:hypothetical protein